MLISLTVGKLDAGLAILLTEDKRLVCPSRPPLLLSTDEQVGLVRLDRVSIHPPPIRHRFGLHRRYPGVAQCAGRGGRQGRFCRPAGRDLRPVRRQFPQKARPAPS